MINRLTVDENLYWRGKHAVKKTDKSTDILAYRSQIG